MPVDPNDYTYLWKDRIVSHPEVLGGKPIIKGTRLSVEFVTDRICNPHAVLERFLKEYTQLTEDDVQACLEYAATGAKLSKYTWAEIDREFNEEEERSKLKWLEDWKNRNASAG